MILIAQNLNKMFCILNKMFWKTLIVWVLDNPIKNDSKGIFCVNIVLLIVSSYNIISEWNYVVSVCLY